MINIPTFMNIDTGGFIYCRLDMNKLLQLEHSKSKEAIKHDGHWLRIARTEVIEDEIIAFVKVEGE